MHILVIPSEEYIPNYAPLAGIFQKHQISVLKEKSQYQIGVISVSLKFSILMVVRAIFFRLTARRVDNELGSYRLFELVKLLVDKLFCIRKFIFVESGRDVNIIRVEGLYYFPPSDKRDHISWLVAGLSAYETYVSEFGVPDVIHAHNALYAGLLACRIKQKFDVNYILTEHSSYYYQRLVPQKLYKRIAEAVSYSSCYTVVSLRLKDTLLETIGEIASRAVYIPNVLPPLYENVSMFQSPESFRNKPQFTFLCVGNLLPVKGHEIVIQAFSTMCANHDNILLKLVGDGPLRHDLEILAENLGVRDKVVFTGEINAVLVREEMLSADVFVFPSRFETFGVALIEAMSCGLPVVSTACGGPDMIVNKDSGILVEPDNVADMARGMSWAIDNVGSIFPERVRASCIRRFGGAIFYKRISQIYSEVVRQKKIRDDLS